MKIRKTNSKRKGLCCKGACHFLKNDVPANPTSQRTLGHLRNVLICSRTSLGTRECSNLLRDVIGDSGMFSPHPSHSGPEIGNIFGTVPRSLEKMGLPSHISHCSGLWRFKKQNKIKISAMWDTVGKSINTKNPTLTCSSLIPLLVPHSLSQNHQISLSRCLQFLFGDTSHTTSIRLTLLGIILTFAKTQDEAASTVQTSITAVSLTLPVNVAWKLQRACQCTQQIEWRTLVY